jgi:beta-xylosidase
LHRDLEQWRKLFYEIKILNDHNMKKALPLFAAVALGLMMCFDAAKAQSSATNPIIYADVPDMAMIRVGDTYYMSSTTMHMSPGLPIMKSSDLVNWRMASYAYDTLADNEALRLENGKNAYGQGSWASSLRYHDGVFYASTFSATTGRTHIYTTRDPEHGPWKAISFAPSLGDHSLFFDDDGRVYMVHGNGRIMLTELKPDLSGIKPGGVHKVLVENVNAVFGTDQGGLKGEGSQLFKINGRYYIFNIASPGSRWARTVIISRADAITGPYESRIAFDDRGIAQGGLIDTPEGKWYAYLFKDNGAVGRIPYLVPVTWKDGWPVLGENGKAPDTLNLPASTGIIPGIVASDEFDRHPGDPALPLVWQWNHNPDNKLWSLTQRPGFLRLTTGRVDLDFVSARNTLTQRTFGPECSGMTAIDVSNMKDGDFAGLALLQKNYGLVGVKSDGGTNFIVMVSAASRSPAELERVPLTQTNVFLKAECDFKNRTDKAKFFYSLDGKSWIAIGGQLKMSFTLPHFMGYRFGLFNFATKTTGGYADFDYFHVGDKIQ